MVFYEVSWGLCGTVILQGLFQLEILNQLYGETHTFCKADLRHSAPRHRLREYDIVLNTQ